MEPVGLDAAGDTWQLGQSFACINIGYVITCMRDFLYGIEHFTKTTPQDLLYGPSRNPSPSLPTGQFHRQ
jgi:hypothetical protein